MMKHIKSRVDRVLAACLVAIMGVLVVDVLWQVFTRFVLRDPSSYTEELARYLLVWVGLLGSAYVAGQRMHLAVDLLPARLTGRRALILDRVIQLAALLFAAVLIVGGSRLVWVTLVLGQNSPALGIPLGVVYTVVPLSGVLMAFYAVCHMADPTVVAATEPID